jgi:hypothetical protein
MGYNYPNRFRIVLTTINTLNASFDTSFVISSCCTHSSCLLSSSLVSSYSGHLEPLLPLFFNLSVLIRSYHKHTSRDSSCVSPFVCLFPNSFFCTRSSPFFLFLSYDTPLALHLFSRDVHVYMRFLFLFYLRCMFMY